MKSKTNFALHKKDLVVQFTKGIYMAGAMYARDDGTLLLVNGFLQIWNVKEAQLVKKLSDLAGEMSANPGKGKLAGSPSAITVNSKDEIILVDSSHGSHRVVIFDKDFNYLREFGKLGEADGDISYGSYVAVDAQDRIYISDHKSEGVVYRVQIFSPEGKHLHTFAQKPAGYTFGMVVCKDSGKIFLTRDDAVQVYSPFSG